MAVFDMYSKRKKARELATPPDVYQYETLPERFRVQVIHIWKDATDERLSWEEIHRIVAREMGVFNLGSEKKGAYQQCTEFLLKADTDSALDIIELTFRCIERRIVLPRPFPFDFISATISPKEAVSELNERFRENGIGFQYDNGEIIRIDSQYLHAEATKPALSLLHSEGFVVAEDDFLGAHEHYRASRYKEAIAEAQKALESTLKAICKAHKWEHPANANAKQLLDMVFTKGLIPIEVTHHIGNLRAALELDVTGVPGYVAAFALHLAASSIVLLVNAHCDYS